MRIGIDLDGVLYCWDKTARYMLRTYRRCEGLAEESTSWDMIQEKVRPADWDWLWTRGVALGLFRYGHVMQGGIVGVNRLANLGHTLVAVTHRPKAAFKDTIDWLSYVQLPFSEVHVLSDGQPKSSVDAKLLIDDKPENIVEWCNKGREGILFSQPWNRGIVFSGLRREPARATGWPGVVDIVRGMK